MNIIKIKIAKTEKKDIIMFIHTETGIEFPNRKAAIILMGESRYKRFLRNKEFIFVNDQLNNE